MGTVDADEIRQRLIDLKSQFDPVEIFDEETATLSCCRPNIEYTAKR